MRLAYILQAGIILFFTAALAAAQDDPRFDTPPQQSFPAAPLGPASINVISSSDGWDNFELSPTFAEPHLSSNPRNPLWYFTAFNTNSAFRSNDGLTWTNSAPAFGVTVAGDPLTAYDSLGNLYYETMYQSGSSIVGCKVIRSTDNGATWSAPVTSVAGVDKNWLAVDQTMGPYANYLYTSQTASSGGNFARSTDFGATWTTTFSPSTQTLPGMMIAVGPNVLNGNNISGGCVYVVTHSGTNALGTYTFYRSTDGGLTFSNMSSNQFSNVIGTEISSRSSVQGMRTRPYPMIAADNSFGTYRGRLYLVYASNNPAGSGNKSDVFLRYSTDQGATWSSPRAVHDDANTVNNFQFFPAIWCDRQAGRLFIKWYDTRNVPTSDSMDVYATYTDDGGQTFAPNQRLTNRSFMISCSTCGGGGTPRYQGDYDAITSNANSALAVWTDFRNGTFLGMTAYFPDYAMLARVSRDTLDFTDSTTAMIKIPAVKLYSQGVKFTASVSPSAPFVLSWPNGDSLSSVPDSLPLKIKTNSVALGTYTINVVAKGPNGTPVHQRNLTIRVQHIPNLVTVLQPNGGEIWIQGQSKKVTWRKTGVVNNVRVDYSTNNGTSWTVINASIPADSGYVNWTLPATPSTQARVRVAWLDSVNTVNDMSDTSFIISAPTPLVSTSNDSLRASVQVGSSGFDTLRLSNSGTVGLTWTSTGTIWANASPSSGSVPADSTRRYAVQFNATGLLGGTYTGNLTINSNDAFHSPLRVPMRMTVVGVPTIVVAPADTLNFGAVQVGRSDTMVIRVRNSGTDTLRGTASVTPPGRFGTLTPTIKLSPGDSSNVRVIFTPLDSTTVYSARLRVLNNDPVHDTVFVVLYGRGAGTTSVQLTSINVVPNRFQLEQNFPNPFNPSTTIRFGIPAGTGGPEVTTLRVFDVLGREVATLINERLAPGTYSAKFDISGLSSGIYFYRLTAGKFVSTKKMVLEK